VKLPYRPEIDGLRAIAVLLVIFHHLGWSKLSGGYVGVDVFFVISGYLITSILQSEIAADTFSVAGFYKRRVIRLAPAYFLVLAATSIAALCFMLPAELLDYGKSVFFSTFFAANFHMWKEVGGYFGGRADVVPLLHLWSLAVEEQFYIFWPLLLLAANRLLRPKMLLAAIAVAIVAGVAVSEWGVRNYLAAAYYMLPTRFFELLGGAFIALLPRPAAASAWVRDLLAGTGLLLIAHASISLTTDSFFPGYAAVLPCLGAALIIHLSGTVGAGTAVGRLLASRPMVHAGRISYPAYLWHWPIIAFLNLNQVAITPGIAAIVLAATFLLSDLTWRFVEQPARRMALRPAGWVMARGFAVPAAIAVGFVAMVQSSHGFPQRYPDAVNRQSAALLSFPSKMRGRCNEGNVAHPLPEDECILGVSGRPVDFLLVGDSHANSLTGMFDALAKAGDLRGYDITQSSTIYLPGVRRFYEQDGEVVEHRNFKVRNDTLEGIIRERHYPAVVLAGYFEARYADEGLRRKGSSTPRTAFEDGFRAALHSIIGAGSKAYVVDGYPTLHDVPYDCALQKMRFGKTMECRVSYSRHLADIAAWEAFLTRMQREFPSLRVIRPDAVLCGPKWCETELAGIPLYRDATHFNFTGSVLLGRQYIRDFGNPLHAIGHAVGPERK
jgi:peptidoglycan/LPS O-acetylase OafA/YrhL